MELGEVEASYAGRLKDLQESLDKETDARVEVEQRLAKVKAELEETVKVQTFLLKVSTPAHPASHFFRIAQERLRF